MSKFSGFRTRLQRATHRRAMDQQMIDEMKDHIEQETARRIAAGEDPATARRHATANFGSVDARAEEVRDHRLGVWLELLWQDLRFAFRQLRKSRGFTAVAIITLALGIGANTAIFSIVNAILLRSLPVPNPHELRILHWTGKDVSLNNFSGSGTSIDGRFEGNAFTHATFEDFRDRAAGVADVFAFFPVFHQTTETAGQVGITDVLMVSGNTFDSLQVNAFVGRTLNPTDDQPNAAPVAVISHRLWQSRYGADSDILQRTIGINRHQFSIIGVMPADHVAPISGDPIDVYVPLAAQPQIRPYRALRSYNNWWLQLMVRLDPGGTEAQLHALLRSSFEHTFEQSSTRADEPDVRLLDGRTGILPDADSLVPPLYALQGVVTLILLIACANLAGLLLARAAARRREFAVCAAIGAQRSRLMRRSLMESLLLAIGGAAVGLLLSVWLKDVLVTMLPNPGYTVRLDLSTDGTVLVFATVITIATALLCGLLPAFRASRTNLITDLHSGRTGGIARQRLGRVLVAAQIALSVLLVAGAGLFIRSLDNLREVDPGFDPQNLLQFRLNADQEGVAAQQRLEYFTRAQQDLTRLPGVTSAAASNIRLLGGSMSSSGFSIPGREPRPGEHMQAHTLVVSDSYFETLHIPLHLGRSFGMQDTADSEPVTIINALLAERHYPDQNPIGQRLRMGGTNYRIIGVSGTTLYDEVRSGPPITMFTSFRQDIPPAMDFLVRSSLLPATLVPAVRQTLTTIDPSIPAADVSTLNAQFDRSLAIERTFATLCGSLGGLALLLCCIGLFGLMTYSIAQRTTEIGIRMALGALPGDIARKVISESLAMTVWGLLAGLPLAIGVGYAVRAAFYNVTPYDPATLIAAITALAAVSAVAAWLPARRAARVDPLTALRSE